MVHPPVPPERRRALDPPKPRGRLRNVDLGARVYRLKAGMWGVAVAVLGIAAGSLASAIGGTFAAFPMIAMGSMLAGALVYILATHLTERAGRAAQTIYNPSGDSTPPLRGYSYAESLVKRARYGDAAAAYELYCLEDPTDPEPYLRLARLYRDQLNQYEDAVTWFRRARSDAQMNAGQHLLVIQELIDIYLRQLKTPRKAIPELALICERFPGTAQAEAAEAELAEMRDMLAREREQMIPFTLQFLKKIGRGSVAAAAHEAAHELERHMVRETLAECGGDTARAAERLGIAVEALEASLSVDHRP